MKTVLIVEDEKLIRKGIKAMVQRSGVPVEVIIECGNGEAALEILKEQEVDVMFTDIRMPKMDGIELVAQMQNLPHRPLTVAISGFDDFSYAVEMLRNGVREYLLKPVEREKITEILEKLNKEIEDNQMNTQTERQVGYQQLKYVFTSPTFTEQEVQLLEQKYSELFFKDTYVICVTGKDLVPEENDAVIFLEDVDAGNVCVVEEKNLRMLCVNDLAEANAGISGIHQGLRELPVAYKEAVHARRRAFCRMEEIQFGVDAASSIPEGLRKQAQKFLTEQAYMQRLQLIGTDKTEELTTQWNYLFEETKKERILPDEFERAVVAFLEELPVIYKNALSEEDKETIHILEKVFEYAGIEEYEEQLMELVLKIHNQINSQEDSNRNQQKMKQAVEYIRENYNKDLNMAVVSNYISMNYSLFSFSFKQYTGSNFVNYLKEIRIAKAKELLSDTDMKVIEISQEVGYDNEKHFMKTFKSVCGVSPSEYRKNMSRD